MSRETLPKRNTGVWLRLLCPALLSTLIYYCQERWLQILLLHLADCFGFFSPLIFHFSDYRCRKSIGCVLFMPGGLRDEEKRQKCFGGEHVGKTDITAPLLNLMAESSEPAGGEGLGLSGEEAVQREPDWSLGLFLAET